MGDIDAPSMLFPRGCSARIRAAQALPGVSTNDDYRSEFFVRGAGFDRVGVYVDGLLYVADTYNSKLKVIDPAKRSSKTFLGGKDETGPLFNEPGGISYADGKLYVADTNAHRIRVVDVKSKEVRTLALEGLEAPKVK